MFALYRGHWAPAVAPAVEGEEEGEAQIAERGDDSQPSAEEPNSPETSESDEVVFDRLELAKALGVPEEHVERLTPKKMKGDSGSSAPSPALPSLKTMEPEPASGPPISVNIPERAEWRAKRIAELK